MDLRQMQYIIAIAQEQNITRAAEKLYITRSALNYSLLNLEKELGVPLFTRLTNRLVPTYAGEIYLKQARQILADCHELEHTMDVLSDRRQGRLNIGITVGGGQDILMQVFPDFHRKYPGLTLKLLEGNSKVLEKALLDGEIDLAWAGNLCEDPLIDHILLRPTAILKLAVPKNHPLISQYHLDKKEKDAVDLRLFKEEPFILMNKNSFVRKKTDTLFHHAGYQPKIMMECSIMRMAVNFVHQGVAPAFVPSNQDILLDRCCLFSVEPCQKMDSTLLFRKGTRFTEAENDLIQRVIAACN